MPLVYKKRLSQHSRESVVSRVFSERGLAETSIDVRSGARARVQSQTGTGGAGLVAPQSAPTYNVTGPNSTPALRRPFATVPSGPAPQFDDEDWRTPVVYNAGNQMVIDHENSFGQGKITFTRNADGTMPSVVEVWNEYGTQGTYSNYKWHFEGPRGEEVPVLIELPNGNRVKVTWKTGADGTIHIDRISPDTDPDLKNVIYTLMCWFALACTAVGVSLNATAYAIEALMQKMVPSSSSHAALLPHQPKTLQGAAPPREQALEKIGF
jgi:hypothetical protein